MKELWQEQCPKCDSADVGEGDYAIEGGQVYFCRECLMVWESKTDWELIYQDEI